MLSDVTDSLDDALASDVGGVRHPVTVVRHAAGPGAPRKVIDRMWLSWAISRRNTSDIARFLGVSRDLVRRALLDYNMVEPGQDPFIRRRDVNNPSIIHYEQVSSVSGAVSSWTDDELDRAVTQLRIIFPNAGVVMLKGALTSMGHNVPRERIRLSLHRIDPNHRLFQRLIIQRRSYYVPGPNFLWHHDGQHGMTPSFTTSISMH